MTAHIPTESIWPLPHQVLIRFVRPVQKSSEAAGVPRNHPPETLVAQILLSSDVTSVNNWTHVRNLTLGAWSVDAKVDATEDYSLEFRNITDSVRDWSSGTVFANRGSVLPIKANRSRGRHAKPEVRIPGGPDSSAAEERACPAAGEPTF